MRLLILAALCSSCALTPTPGPVVIQKVPVRIPCTEASPVEPVSLILQAKKEDTIFVKMQLALAEIAQRKGYEKELSAALEACKQ